MAYTKRDWTRQFFPLAIIALGAAACDSASPPEDVWEDFDPQAVMAAAESVVAPAAATTEANVTLFDAASALIGMGVEFSPQARARAPRQPALEVSARTVAFRTMVSIPAELRGRTFVFNPSTGEWQVDDGRAGAPANGLRIIYYATAASGDYTLPLTERGYIDLTDEDTSTHSRVGVLIVRTAGGANVTLADYAQGHAESETTTASVSRIEAEGFFSDGSDQVAFTLLSIDSLDHATEDAAWSFGMTFEGEDTHYDWQAEGVDAVNGDYNEDYAITLSRAGEPTRLDLNFTGTVSTDDASGMLSHAGATLADVALSATGDFLFTKPGGGSFTQSERQTLESLLLTLIFSGFNVLAYLPLLFV